jgi:hypothetical protein
LKKNALEVVFSLGFPYNEKAELVFAASVPSFYYRRFWPMVQLIVGNKGKGKTKVLLDKVNTEIRTVPGNIVYLDKNTKHMYELNNKVRLIDVSQYMFENSSEFVGFLCGIISQDHDLQQMYLDNFMRIANTDLSEIESVLSKITKISEQFDVAFYISLSVDEADLPAGLKDKVLMAL